jgi:hypothetical protein
VSSAIVAHLSDVDATVAPPTSTARPRTAILPELSDDERKRLRELHLARKAYKGDWKGRQALKVGMNEPDDNVNVNRCGPIVDKGASWLANKEIKLQVMNGAGTDSGPVAAQDYLMAAIGNIDDFMTLVTNIKISGGVAGHAFAKLVPSARKGQYPRIIALDPANVWVEADPEDCNTADRYNIMYDWRNPADPENPWQKRQVIERNDPDDVMEPDPDGGTHEDTWTITSYVRPKPKDVGGHIPSVAWTIQGEPEVWQHDWSPIHDCKNLPSECSYYGTPDITPDLIHLNEVLNRVLSYIAKICRLHGHPWPWTAGVEARAIQIAPGNVLCLPDPNAKLELAEAHGDLVNMMHFADSLRSDMDELSRVPGVALGRIDVLPRGNLPGTAMELLFQPLIEKTTHVRRLYGGLIRSLCEHILELGDFPGLTVNLVWPNLLPIDDTAAAQTGTLLMTLGVSQDTILQELGYDPDIEAAKTAHEQNEKMKQQAGFAAKAGTIPAAATQQVTAPGSVAPVQPAQPESTGGGPPTSRGTPPPVNHPAAVAARARLTAATAKR